MCINTLARPPSRVAANNDSINDGTAGHGLTDFVSATLAAVSNGNCSLTIWYGTVLQGAERLRVRVDRWFFNGPKRPATKDQPGVRFGFKVALVGV